VVDRKTNKVSSTPEKSVTEVTVDENEDNGGIKCNDCDKWFKNRRTLAGHVKVHKKKKSIPSNEEESNKYD
jgi:hypothetical protein